MEIGHKIRKIRELKGYSQEYMANQLELSQRSYSRIESNGVDLTLSKLQKISKVLEVSVQKILGFDESFIFSNCENAYGASNQTNYQYSEKEREQYQSQIDHLKGEVIFLRSQLENFSK